ncbi:MAG: Transcriptional regulator, MerR family [Microgenomates bacterium 39_6]|nr:MAG: Transcriptional regulator, MerR family [Microgenomates bacterium 39_6]
MSNWDEIHQQSYNYKYYDLHKPHEDLKLVTDEFRRHNVKRVLDIGCGLGNNLLPLLKYGFDIYGIDSSQEAVARTQDLLTKEGKKPERVVNASFEKIPFSDGWFDAVLSIQTLQHGKEAQIKQGVAEITRILKPEGLLFISLPGRYAHGKERYCLVTTARKIEKRTFVPTQGEEIGIPHHIFNKSMLLEYFCDFTPMKIWQDKKDYYCFLGKKK